MLALVESEIPHVDVSAVGRMGYEAAHAEAYRMNELLDKYAAEKKEKKDRAAKVWKSVDACVEDFRRHGLKVPVVSETTSLVEQILWMHFSNLIP